MSSSRLSTSIFFPLRFVIFLWIIFFAEVVFNFDLSIFGILPRTAFGVIGVFASPLIHGNYLHLVSNSVPLLILGTLLFFFYDRIAPLVFFYCYFLTGIL